MAKLTERWAKFFYIVSRAYYGIYAIIAAIGLVFPNKISDVAFSLPMGIVDIVMCALFLWSDYQFRPYFPDCKIPRWMQVISATVVVAFLVFLAMRAAKAS